MFIRCAIDLLMSVGAIAMNLSTIIVPLNGRLSVARGSEFDTCPFSAYPTPIGKTTRLKFCRTERVISRCSPPTTPRENIFKGKVNCQQVRSWPIEYETSLTGSLVAGTATSVGHSRFRVGPTKCVSVVERSSPIFVPTSDTARWAVPDDL